MIFLGSLITSLQESLIDRTIGDSSHITIRSEEDGVSRFFQENNSDGMLLRGNYSNIEKSLSNWTLIIDQLQGDRRVTAISPVIQSTALIRSSGKNQTVQVKGIQRDQADKIYEITERLIQGDPDVEGNSILIGTQLSENLGIGIGGVVSLLTPKGETVRFLVGGVFDLKNESINESLIFMDLKRAQKLFQLGSGITAIEVQITEPFQADTIAEEWESLLGEVKIDQWKAQNQQLLSALASQSSSSYTIQFFVILAVTLGISSVLAVSVIQKSKEIGILKAMGATKASASRVFLLQGLILGVLGSVVGAAMGILLLSVYQLFNQGNSSLVINYEWSSILIIGLIATAAGTFASVIPARRSANLNPMEAIKNG
ncbi:MAG: FtsX-like permease family protein, partial [Eubacteriales bacterium]|nr:FtsX-like permease family protein [Eubacteriales bacterium]